MLRKKITSAFFALWAVVALGLMSSCSDDSEKPNFAPDDLCTDFATFVNSNEQGSVFTLRKSGDSDLVTLTSNIKIDTKQIAPGKRVIIQYVPSGGQQPYESGPIILYGYQEVYNAGIDPQPLETIESWQSDALILSMISRSGQYIDLSAQLSFGEKVMRFVLAADESTLADEYPQLYLVFTADNAFATNHQLNASFDISSVWNLPTAKGIDINYKVHTDDNNHNSKATVTFKKMSLQPSQPQQ